MTNKARAFLLHGSVLAGCVGGGALCLMCGAKMDTIALVSIVIVVLAVASVLMYAFLTRHMINGKVIHDERTLQIFTTAYAWAGQISCPLFLLASCVLLMLSFFGDRNPTFFLIGATLGGATFIQLGVFFSTRFFLAGRK